MVASHKLQSKDFVVYMFGFPNDKSYVGRTCNFAQRLKNHNKKSSGCIYLKRCLNKYGGWKNVDITILKSNVKGAYLANQWEKFFINIFDTLAPRGLNCTPGGDGVCFTDEIRRKIGDANRGKKWSKKQCIQHKQTMRDVWKTRIVTEYTRMKLSKINKDRKFTKEHCKNISISRKKLNIRLTDAQKQHLRIINLGKKMPEEAVKKAVATRIANGNHKHKEETKIKIGDKKRGIPLTEDHKQKLKDGHKKSTFDRATTRKYTDEHMLLVFKELEGDRKAVVDKLGIHYNTLFRCLKRNNMAGRK
jgi:group I intron endonuclease